MTTFLMMLIRIGRHINAALSYSPAFPTHTLRINPAASRGGPRILDRKWRYIAEAVWLVAIRSGARAAKGANFAGARVSRRSGTHFAHSVTILLSGFAWFVVSESVQSGQVMLM